MLAQPIEPRWVDLRDDCCLWGASTGVRVGLEVLVNWEGGSTGFGEGHFVVREERSTDFGGLKFVAWEGGSTGFGEGHFVVREEGSNDFGRLKFVAWEGGSTGFLVGVVWVGGRLSFELGCCCTWFGWGVDCIIPVIIRGIKCVWVEKTQVLKLVGKRRGIFTCC